MEMVEVMVGLERVNELMGLNPWYFSRLIL